MALDEQYIQYFMLSFPGESCASLASGEGNALEDVVKTMQWTEEEDSVKNDEILKKAEDEFKAKALECIKAGKEKLNEEPVESLGQNQDNGHGYGDWMVIGVVSVIIGITVTLIAIQVNIKATNGNSCNDLKVDQ